MPFAIAVDTLHVNSVSRRRAHGGTRRAGKLSFETRASLGWYTPASRRAAANKTLVHQGVDLNGLLGGLEPKRVYLCEAVLELGLLVTVLLVAAVIELLSAHRALLVSVDKIKAAAATHLMLE